MLTQCRVGEEGFFPSFIPWGDSLFQSEEAHNILGKTSGQIKRNGGITPQQK